MRSIEKHPHIMGNGRQHLVLRLESAIDNNLLPNDQELGREVADEFYI